MMMNPEAENRDSTDTAARQETTIITETNIQVTPQIASNSHVISLQASEIQDTSASNFSFPSSPASNVLFPSSPASNFQDIDVSSQSSDIQDLAPFAYQDVGEERSSSRAPQRQHLHLNLNARGYLDEFLRVHIRLNGYSVICEEEGPCSPDQLCLFFRN
ncbi:hypothetical protein Bpfe_026310 [Biomphalaria pfeifferi]|uniref:Uncharacterized protein n=1 Tax=Biomphalaria pfeifferi TaxID=112525 RepID=A0AAD8AZ44_BIOPF|nr:hypothetical protein Bpfe_026310 [Biomphalaria pfeifferi]